MGILDVAKKMLDIPATPNEVAEAICREDYVFAYKNFKAYKEIDKFSNPEAKLWPLVQMIEAACKANDVKALFEMGQYGVEYMKQHDLIKGMEDNKGPNAFLFFADEMVKAAYTLKKYNECMNMNNIYCGDLLVPQTLGHAIVLMSVYESLDDKDDELRDLTKLGEELYAIFSHNDFFTGLDRKSANECVIAFYDFPRTLATMCLKHQIASALNRDNPLLPIVHSLAFFGRAKDNLPKLAPGYEKISKMIDEAIELLASIASEIGER